jgi:hypothetical protein
MYTLFIFFPLIFNNLEEKPVTGMKGQDSLGFCDVMNQTQNKTNRMVQTGMKSKFLVE